MNFIIRSREVLLNINPQGMILILFIMIVLFLLIPRLLSKKTGKSPLELLLGVRGKKAGEKKKPRETNGSRNDLMSFVSTLLSYSRRNQFNVVYPGLICWNGKSSNLIALLVTRCGVIGINAYGFGGVVYTRNGGREWLQNLNDEERPLADLSAANRESTEIARAALDANGMQDLPFEAVGVFTNPHVTLNIPASCGCYSKKGLMEYLKDERFLRDGGIDPKKTGARLAELIHQNLPKEPDPPAAK